MRHVKSQRLYPVLVIVVLAGVMLGHSLRQRQTAQAAQSSLQNSIYWQPWAASGVWCQSELDLQNPRIPFSYKIGHPPGDRELVHETVRRLIRTGATPQPWSEQSIQAFLILRTDCVDSWSELYGMLKAPDRAKVAALLNNPEHPTEEDYRQAIIRANYERMGTVDAALEWYSEADERNVNGNP